MNTRKRKMVIGIVILVILIGGVLVWLNSGIAVGQSQLEVTKEEVHFPTVSGFNLMRQEFVFPRDFGGEYNLLLIPFQQWQQREVNTWIAAAQELEREVPGMVYYELPTIYQLPTLSRTFINEGMRAGIPDQTARERTITFYIDKETFKKSLAIPGEDTITVLLVDQQGGILWRNEGVFTEEKLQSLRERLTELQ